jgi:hypothetical protein
VSRDRYLGLRSEMNEIKRVLIGAATGIVTLLVAVLGYLIAHGSLPLAH